MTHTLRLLVVLLFASMLGGCASSGPTAAGVPTSLSERVQQHLEAQRVISNRTEQLHAELLATARQMREMKDEANRLSMSSRTNELALQEIQKQVVAYEKEAAAAQARAREEAAHVEALEKALGREKSLRLEQEKAAAGRGDQSDQLKAALAREQQAREQLERDLETLRRNAGAAGNEAPVAVVQMVAAGNTALRKKQLDVAEKYFTEALSAAPGFTGARLGLAACRYERGDLKEADETLSPILKKDERNAQAWGLQGLLCWRQGKGAEAERALTRAVELQPADSQLRNYLGIVQYDRRDFPASIASLTQSTELDPGNAEAQYNLAVVLSSATPPRMDEARTHYQKSLQLGSAPDPNLEKLIAPAAKP